MSIPNRLLESYWHGVAVWVVQRTERASRPHREVTAMLRTLVVEVGDLAVSRRHGGDRDPLVEALDRLDWQAGIAAEIGALNAQDCARLHEAIACMRHLA